MKRSTLRATDGTFAIAMMAAMAVWGLSWVSGRILAVQAPVALTIFWRMLLTALSYAAILSIRRESWKIDRRGLLWTLAAALFLGTYNYCFFAGLAEVQSGTAGLLVATLNPLFALAFGAVIGAREVRGVQWLGLAMGLFGGLIQLGMFSWFGLGDTGGQISDAALTGRGTWLLLGAAASWAALTVCSSRAQGQTSVFVFSWWLYLIASAMTLPFAMALPGGIFSEGWLHPAFVLQVVFLSLIVGTLATTVYFYGAKRLGSTRTASFTFLLPVAAVLLGWLILNEVPEWYSFIGGVLSLGAVAVINFTKR